MLEGFVDEFNTPLGAWVWDAVHGARELTTLAGDRQWLLRQVVAVRDRGQIIGHGEQGGHTYAFVLVVPPAAGRP